jgi:hypothetical protein
MVRARNVARKRGYSMSTSKESSTFESERWQNADAQIVSGSPNRTSAPSI